jgi:hypothetical protein
MALDCLFKLDRAAKLASTHAGRDVTPDDFVEAAARGQIALVAICPRAVTMEPCWETYKPLVIAAGSLPPLPLAACQQLQVNGHANWRTIDGVEQIKSGMLEGQLGRFDRWKLPEAEPDISITLDDCRVLGYVIHALADEFIRKPALAKSAAPPEPVVDSFIDEPTPSQSTPVKKSRSDLMTPVVKAAQNQCANPSDSAEVFNVLKDWAKAPKLRPPLFGVTGDGNIQWSDSNDKPQELTRRSLAKRLERQKSRL